MYLGIHLGMYVCGVVLSNPFQTPARLGACHVLYAHPAILRLGSVSELPHTQGLSYGQFVEARDEGHHALGI